MTKIQEELKEAADKYIKTCDVFDAAKEEDKTAIAWRCFVLHHNYREAWTARFKEILREIYS